MGSHLGPVADLAQRWLHSASPEDLTHISKLHIPWSLVDSIPLPLRKDLPYHAAWHQYHMMHTRSLLRQSLPMPPIIPGAHRGKTTSTPVWYTSLCRKAVHKHPADDVLPAQVNYKPTQVAKHKKGPKREGPSPDARARILLTNPPTIDTTNALLRMLPQLSHPECACVYEYVSTNSTIPHHPSPLLDQALGHVTLYAMHYVARAHRMWTTARPELVADIRAHHFTRGACRITQWFQKILATWRTTM